MMIKPNLVNLADKYGYTTLHYAAQNDHISIVKFLLDLNADSNASLCGATPLHRAGIEHYSIIFMKFILFEEIVICFVL